MTDPYLIVWWLNNIAQPIAIIVGMVVLVARLLRKQTLRGGRPAGPIPAYSLGAGTPVVNRSRRRQLAGRCGRHF